MIQVVFEENKEKKTIALRMEGHAGQAADGKDIICAAASILAYTAAQTVSYMFSDGKLRRKPCIRLAKGNVLISVRPRQEYYEEALYALFVTQVGYSLLAKNYPQFLKLSMFGQAADPR